MKKIYFALLAVAVAGLASCGGDDPQPAPTPTPTPTPDAVEVTIGSSAIETKANQMLVFGSGDKMNIWAKTYNRLDAPNIVDNVVASYDGTAWTMSPKVYISSTTYKNAFIYAVAPYDASYTDPVAIPVDTKKQVDLMYSGSYVPASLTSPQIKLNMKHALALASFNIVPFGYKGAGKISQLSFDGDIVYTTGTMDVSTGKIIPTGKDKVVVNTDKTVTEGGFHTDLPAIWTIPFNTKTGDVQLSIVIDGKTFTATLPEVEMKSGWQYIFRLTLTANGLEFDPTKTETASLNVLDEQTPDFLGFGTICITASSSSTNQGLVCVPTLQGDGVFGTVITAGGNKAYAPSITAEATAGQTVIVESWNSTGFTIENIDGIDVVDLTGY